MLKIFIYTQNRNWKKCLKKIIMGKIGIRTQIKEIKCIVIKKIIANLKK